MRSNSPAPSGRRLVVCLGLAFGAAVALPALASAQQFTVYQLTSSTDGLIPVPLGGAAGSRYMTTVYAQPTELGGRIGFVPSGRGLHNATADLSVGGAIVATDITDDKGNFRFKFKPFAAGQYQVSVRDLAADIYTVNLRLSPRLQLNHPKRLAAPGQSLTVRGNVRPRAAATGINRAVLQYQQGPSGGWQQIANGPVGGDGSFAINYKAPRGQNLKVRVYVPPQNGWVAAAKGFPLAVS